jgi:hypothetical protein
MCSAPSFSIKASPQLTGLIYCAVQGVFLRRNVVNVAGRALKVNLQRLGPLVLPVTEMVRLTWPPAYLSWKEACTGTLASSTAGLDSVHVPPCLRLSLGTVRGAG